MKDGNVEFAGYATIRSRIYQIWALPMAQILIISFICFCCPGVRLAFRQRLGHDQLNCCLSGMYNAIGGLGGSGQLDSTVAANATVALLAATAASALTIVPSIFDVSYSIFEPTFQSASINPSDVWTSCVSADWCDALPIFESVECRMLNLTNKPCRRLDLSLILRRTALL